jgi:hypothetical protein
MIMVVQILVSMLQRRASGGSHEFRDFGIWLEVELRQKAAWCSFCAYILP